VAPASAHQEPTRIALSGTGAASSSGRYKPGAAQAARIASVHPDRVFEDATPGPGVPALAVVGPSSQVIAAGATAAVAVQTAPNGDVTFTVREGGAFPNGLPSITVLADGDGVARTVFTATAGTVDDAHIQAGSPQAVGHLLIPIHITYPGSPFEGSRP
jgi:hypothetical protein